MISEDQFKRIFPAQLSHAARQTSWRNVSIWLLGDGQGNVVVPSAQAHQYRKFYAHKLTEDGRREIIQAVNGFAGFTWDDTTNHGVPVRIGKPPNSDEYTIIGPADFRMGQYTGGILPSQIQGAIGSITTPDRLQFLRLIPGGSMVLSITSGHYRAGDTWAGVRAQNLADMTGNIPSAGKSVWILVTWDTVAGEPYFTTGSEVTTANIGDAATSDCPKAIPTDHVLLGAVKLADTHAELVMADIMPLLDLVATNAGTTTSGGGGGSANAFFAEGRLNATNSFTTLGHTTAFLSNATGTIYYLPFIGTRITLYYDGDWRVYTFGTLSTTVSAAGVYDVFAYYTGAAVALETVAWTDSTNRASNLARSTATGRYVKGLSGNDLERSYLGTVYCYDAGGSTWTIDDGTAARHVWNYYNRLRHELLIQSATSSWALADNAITDWTGSEANASYVLGVEEEAIEFEATGAFLYAGADDGRAYVLFDVDGTDIMDSGTSGIVASQTPASFEASGTAIQHAQAQLIVRNEGFHDITLREYFNSSIGVPGTDTITSYGQYTDGSLKTKTGAHGFIMR